MAKLSKHTFRISRPFNQNLVCALILFCLPGIYTALTGLGAGGGKPTSLVVANQTNAILYGLYALFACLGGSIVNLLRPKLSLIIGAVGYPLYVGSLWYYDRTGATWFPLFAGAILGVTCGILWTCVSMVAFSYPQEQHKGLYLSIQWAMRSLGASVGSAISFAANFNQKKAVGVTDPVYITFIFIHCLAFVLAGLFALDPKDVIRDDGTHLAIFKQPTVVSEIKALGRCFRDKRMLLLTPAMIVCEMALGMTSTINGFYFNLRTRSLANLAFQLVQIISPMVLVAILDTKRIKSRQRRGTIGAVLMGVVAIGACCGLYGWMYKVDYAGLKTAPGTDWTDSGFGGLFAVYVLFGWVYAGFQMSVEWCSSSLSNDPTKSAQSAGYMRGMASLGLCIGFVMAAQQVPLVGQLSLQFALYIIGLVGMLWVLRFHIKETNYFDEDNVIAPQKIAEQIIDDQGGLSDDQAKNIEKTPSKDAGNGLLQAA